MLIAALAFVYSVFDPGEITRVTFDKQARQVVADRSGLFATSMIEIPFSDIAAVRIETRYDDDGYESNIPIMVLTGHKVIQLPAGTTAADVAKMRDLMKRG